MKKSMLFYLFFFNFSISLIASEPTLGTTADSSTTNTTLAQSFTCYNKLPDALKYFIADYAGLNSPQGDHGSSPLQESVELNDFHAVVILINCGALVNGTTPEQKCPPLHGAVEDFIQSHKFSHVEDSKEYLKILHFLIIRGAESNYQHPDAEHRKNLHKEAAKIANPIALRLLIEAQVNINIKNYKNAKKANAQSSIELKPMPTDETMQHEYDSSHVARHLKRSTELVANGVGSRY